MYRAGVDLSHRKVDVCLLSPAGEVIDGWASGEDDDAARDFTERAALPGRDLRAARRRV